MTKYWNMFLILLLLCGVVYIALGVYKAVGKKDDPKTTTWSERLIEKWTDVRELPPSVEDDLSSAETMREPMRETTSTANPQVQQAQPSKVQRQAQAPKAQPRYYRITEGMPVRSSRPPYQILYIPYTIDLF